MVHHGSKAPTPPKAKQIGGVTDEEDGTLDGFCGFRRLLVVSPCRYRFK
jgi:hypothetical protein